MIQQKNNELPKNIQLGVSIEDQQTANERIPLLLKTPAAVRFLSCEPLLGPIDFSKVKLEFSELLLWKPEYHCHLCGTGGKHMETPCDNNCPSKPIDWVIVGGESGPNARPMHPDWVRTLRNQCQAAKVPFFFKQWGEYAPHMDVQNVKKVSVTHNGIGYEMCKVGKKKAGHLLDGVEYREFPK